MKAQEGSGGDREPLHSVAFRPKLQRTARLVAR